MVIRNRLLAVIFRIVFFFVLATAFSAYLSSTYTWVALLEFEVQTALLYQIGLTIAILMNLLDLRHGIHGIAAGAYMPFMLNISAFTFVSNVFYFAYSLPNGTEASNQAAIVFHALFMVIPTLEWLLFDIKGTVKWYSAFSSMLYPVLYVVFMGFRALIWPDAVLPNGTMYTYPFLKPGWDIFIWWAILSFFVVYGVCLAYIFFNNLLAGKYRAKQEINPF